MSTHPMGAPGSVARFLDDHAHDPNAKPFPAPWCVFTYRSCRPHVPNTDGGPLLLGSGPTKEAAEQVKGAGEREYGWAIVVDVRTYRCRVVSE